MSSKTRFPFLPLFLFVWLLTACAIAPQPTASYVWPKPPDTPRIAYELTLKNNNSLQPVESEDLLRRFATGQATAGESVLLKPYDIAAANGLIVVTDSLAGVAHVFDVRRKKMFSIGWRREGKLSKPLGVALDGKQNIYIVDAGRGAVVKYDRLGLYLATIGQKSDFSHISDVAVSETGENIYVLDRGGVGSTKHQITLFNAQGIKQKIIGRRGHKTGEFNHPTQLALAKNGKIYVLDSGNFRVQVFGEQGNYEKQWGRPGNKSGNFARPRGIAVDVLNRVYVTDSAYQNFQVFNSDGQLLLAVGDGAGKDLPGRYVLPAGIAVDETQRIYVVDQVRRKVEVYRLLSPIDNNDKPQGETTIR